MSETVLTSSGAEVGFVINNSLGGYTRDVASNLQLSPAATIRRIFVSAATTTIARSQIIDAVQLECTVSDAIALISALLVGPINDPQTYADTTAGNLALYNAIAVSQVGWSVADAFIKTTGAKTIVLPEGARANLQQKVQQQAVFALGVKMETETGPDSGVITRATVQLRVTHHTTTPAEASASYGLMNWSNDE